MLFRSKWFELKLDRPHCGRRSVQLVGINDQQDLELVRGCRVRSVGGFFVPITGYYSRDLAQEVHTIEPIVGCVRQPPLPDLSGAKPDRDVLSYRAEIVVDRRPGDHPITVRATSAGRTLRPWLAYVDHFLTGGWVMYAKCGDGFAVVAPDPEWCFSDDPGSPKCQVVGHVPPPWAAGPRFVRLRFECRRLDVRD